MGSLKPTNELAISLGTIFSEKMATNLNMLSSFLKDWIRGYIYVRMLDYRK